MKFGFEKYLKGIKYPSRAKYAAFVCLNCGFQPLSCIGVECDFCGSETDKESCSFNQNISIAVGCLILYLFDSELKGITPDSEDKARQVVTKSIKSWANAYSLKDGRVARLLHKWLVPGNELCYKNQDLYAHYKGEYERQCSEDSTRADFITRVAVNGLFGQLSYSIEMENDFTVIVGPNAIGKTTVFNLMECLLTNPRDLGTKLTNVARLLDTQFDVFSIDFEGGARIVASHQSDGLHISYYFMRNFSGYTGANSINFEMNPDSFYFTKVNRINDFEYFSRNLRNKYFHNRIGGWDDIKQMIQRYQTPAFENSFNDALSECWDTIYHIVGKNTTKTTPLLVEEQTIYMLDEIISKGLYFSDREETLLPIREYLLSWARNPYKRKRDNKDSKALYDSINKLYSLSKCFDYFKEKFQNIYYDDDLTIKTPIIGKNGQIQFKCQSTGAVLSPGQLSSGEVNLATVLFDLIFKMKEGSVMLIDEPEISLHLIWQQHFADMVLDILQYKNMEAQVIIASHSPFISSGHAEFITGVKYEQ